MCSSGRAYVSNRVQSFHAAIFSSLIRRTYRSSRWHQHRLWRCGGARAWVAAKPHILTITKQYNLRTFTAAAVDAWERTSDGTSISGFTRTIRYTADEEEGLIEGAAQTIPETELGKITATAYYVKNLTTDTDVVDQGKDKIMPIASITKLVTAVIARKVIEDDERITISRDIIATYGNTASFTIGETFRAADLYYPLLMVSSNDAAEALAREYGREEFIERMNEFVQSIGAYRTNFKDPSGLSPDNVSSPSDLALIADWIRKNDPEVIRITAEKSRIIRNHTWINPTHFLNWSTYIGGKNGYLPEANRTGVSLFTLGSKKDVYAIVILGSESRDRDVVNLLEKANR
jgi:D-alanyl-D-alanine carboxypeptidase